MQSPAFTNFPTFVIPHKEVIELKAWADLSG